ncbi:MAG: dihydroneopterin aldolase [Clostridiales bacterium]|nr:dihydroneopterin aldolase [Clostridiales bacterium]
MDKIIFPRLSFLGRHGYYEEERRAAQPFGVSLEIELDLCAAAATDDLGQSVDYAYFYHAARRRVEETTCLLLETLAQNIAGDILAREKVRAVKITLTKEQALFDGKAVAAAVSLERRKGE